MINSLIRSLRNRLPDDFLAIAVIGPGAAQAADSLFAIGYKQVWQRDEPEAVLSLYQPGRLFDVIVLARCLEHFTDPSLSPRACPELRRRAFDQIDASLADGGLLCVWASAFTADGLMELLAGHGFSTREVQGPDRPKEPGGVIGIFRGRR